jgi:hypothetical protein
MYYHINITHLTCGEIRHDFLFETVICWLRRLSFRLCPNQGVYLWTSAQACPKCDRKGKNKRRNNNYKKIRKPQGTVTKRVETL